MKSERRHELQQNSLAEELGQIQGFLQKHGTKLSWGLLIVAAVVLGVVMLNRRSQSQQVDTQMRYDQLKRQAIFIDEKNSPELIAGFTGLAGQDTVRWIAADSLLELGRIHANTALQAEEPAEVDSALARALQSYQQVLGRFEDLPAMAAAARVGLGKIAEGQGQLDKAREHYQAVVDSPQMEGYPVYYHARDALATLNGYQNPVALATTQPAWMQEQIAAENRPETQPATAPAEPAADESADDAS
jgi:predicted negative regulator of RcsB-dependent stress response